MIKTKRLFVAIKANAGIELQATQIIKKLRQNADAKNIEVRWVRPENLHITLHFIGEILIEKIDPIKTLLSEVAEEANSFQIKVEDVSGFSSELSARVIYLGIPRSQKILDLVTLVENKLGASSNEDFNPHLSIGRLRNPKSVKDLISPFKRKKFGKINVNEIILYESIQSGPFPVYKPICSYVFADKSQNPPQ